MGQRGRKKPKRLSEKLLAIRFKLEVSQSQLAKLLEFDKGVARISEYERRRPRARLIDVAEILRAGSRLHERIG